MTNKDLKQYIRNHKLSDGLLDDFIDRKLYSSAIKELPRVIHAYELKIFALQQFESLIDLAKIEEDKLSKL